MRKLVNNIKQTVSDIFNGFNDAFEMMAEYKQFEAKCGL